MAARPFDMIGMTSQRPPSSLTNGARGKSGLMRTSVVLPTTPRCASSSTMSSEVKRQVGTRTPQPISRTQTRPPPPVSRHTTSGTALLHSSHRRSWSSSHLKSPPNIRMAGLAGASQCPQAGQFSPSASCQPFVSIDAGMWRRRRSVSRFLVPVVCPRRAPPPSSVSGVASWPTLLAPTLPAPTPRRRGASMVCGSTRNSCRRGARQMVEGQPLPSQTLEEHCQSSMLPWHS
mmetsp:Transcript_2231/g.4790  ORF Transcript_2231/g.4790 Transcript_2231/m.4790 type:complete len:232 (-) Transcript_2231:580-1275(-)